MARNKALIKPELLVWTRNRAKVSIEDAAQAVSVAVEALEAWEGRRRSDG